MYFRKKASILFLVLIFIFTLASCKKDSTVDAASTVSPTISDYAETSAFQEKTTENRTTKAQTTENSSVEITVPQSTDEIIALYNKAVAETPSLKRTAFTRKLQTCMIEIGSYFKGDISKDPLTAEIVEVNDKTPRSNDLPKLNSSMVSKAGSDVSGDTLTLNIQLKQFFTTDPKHGDGGYMGALSDKQIRELVFASAKSLGGDIIQSVDIITTEGKLVNGSFTVKLNKTTGHIQSVQFHGEQEESGTADVKGKLVINLTVRGAKADMKVIMDAHYAA